MRGCGLTSLVACINDKSCDKGEKCDNKEWKCVLRWSNKQKHFFIEGVWNHPKGNTQNFFSLSVDGITLVGDMVDEVDKP